MATHAISTTGRWMVFATAALFAGGAAVGTSASSAGPADAPPQEIACGGYAADGDLLRPAAAAITHAQLTDRGLDVPDTCGGYTEDGEFIGDD